MHTPGPWNVNDGRGQGGPEDRIAIEAGDNPPVNGIVTATVNKMIPEAMANAKLISAAPDLFEAALTMAHAEDSGGDGWWRGFSELKAALKKAGGQFPSMDQM